MNTTFQKMGIVAALAAATLLPACSTDDETTPPEPAAPEITLISSATSTTFWNTVKLTATATAEQGIDKIELKIDGASVGTAATSPYEFSWDTQKVTDGPHIATAIATDKTGVEKTAELKVTVQNTLLVAKIDAHMLELKEEFGYEEHGFIFLSDHQGNVIIAQEFKNGDAISLKVPAFEGGEFSISEVVTKSWPPDYTYTSTTITTTTGVSRGKWVLKAPAQQRPGGLANLSFINRHIDLDYVASTNVLGTYPLYDGRKNVPVEAGSSLLYITSQPKDGSGIPKYHVFPPIVDGVNPTPLDLALVNKPLTEETVALPQDRSDNGSVLLYGLRTVNGVSELYHLDIFYSDAQKKLTLRYPDDGFDGLLSFTRASGPEYTSSNTSRKPYDFTPLAATLNGSRSGRKLTVAASGTMDMIHCDLYTNYLSWTIAADKGTTSIIIPDIPAIVNGVNNVNVDITGAGLSIYAEDYADLQDYKSYLDGIREPNLRANFPEHKSLYKGIK